MNRKTTWEKPTLVRLGSGAGAEVGFFLAPVEGNAGGKASYTLSAPAS